MQLNKEMITQVIFCCIIINSKKHVTMVAIGLSKLQALDADRKAIREIDFTRI